MFHCWTLFVLPTALLDFFSAFYSSVCEILQALQIDEDRFEIFVTFFFVSFSVCLFWGLGVEVKLPLRFANFDLLVSLLVHEKIEECLDALIAFGFRLHHSLFLFLSNGSGYSSTCSRCCLWCSSNTLLTFIIATRGLSFRFLSIGEVWLFDPMVFLFVFFFLIIVLLLCVIRELGRKIIWLCCNWKKESIEDLSHKERHHARIKDVLDPNTKAEGALFEHALQMLQLLVWTEELICVSNQIVLVVAVAIGSTEEFKSL